MAIRFKILIFLGFCLVWGSCQKVDPFRKPKNLIPDDKMVNILVDLAKIDAARSVNVSEFERLGGDSAKYLLYEKYDIDSVQLVQSTIYYAQKLEMNDSIYSRVKNQLSKESDSLLKEKNGAPDSE